MLRRLARLPLLVQFLGLASLLMLVPAAYALVARDWQSARAFGYSALIFIGIFAMLGVATANYVDRSRKGTQLFAFLGAYVLLPVVLAVPFYEAVQNTRFINAYFEMVSCLTTTGAVIYEIPGRLPDAVHLWRALVGWTGGFLIWVAAAAIMAPLNLGGFEVLAIRQRTGQTAGILAVADASRRLRRYAQKLFPIYAGLTLALWVALLLSGEVPLVAVSHAMSTLATSGITPANGTAAQTGGFMAEIVILAFLLFALSRRTFERQGAGRRRVAIIDDPEIRMAAAVIVIVPLLLFLRHWYGAIEVEAGQSLQDGGEALWGAVFTVASFLTTTGFKSLYWADAQAWSGLATPGLVLVGLALIGGGVATTAGGVKLLRVYALYLHGRRELDRLVHPNSVGGAGPMKRHLRGNGAQISWVFFMLFAISIAVVMLALSLAGIDFSSAVVLALATLSNTGPLVGAAMETPLSLTALGDAAKLILAAAMVLGRLETLVIIALLNPEFWRK